MTSSPPPLRTIQRAFEIVHLLWEQKGAGPAAIAEHMDIPKSTAHDHLRSLEATGYVVKEDGKYRVGYRFLTMGGRLKHCNRLFHISKPELQALAEDTGKIANISVEEDGKWVLLHSEKGTRSLDPGTYPGMTTPLYTHAAGKVQLAHFPQRRIDEILDASDLDQMTEETVTDRETLRVELAEIRDRGYAVDWDQQVTGMGVVAVPLVVDDDVLGAVAIVCPTGRLQDEPYRDELVHKVQEVANTVTITYRYGTR